MGVPLTTEVFVRRHKADLQACGFDTQFVFCWLVVLHQKK